ncbi:TetR/AcrR family transcriptional regulator [Agreia sp.]|uniref:TetR/AcrR family transcriptional regulator n=1 Tax=Agreia sp. TaxID=1872416 RepID=UPI0035BBA582
MAAGTRQRMVEAAAVLLRDGGMEAANFSDVLDLSGAARGAIYHHFPQGKSEMIHAAVTWTGERVRANLDALPGDDASQVVTAFLEAIRPVVGEASTGSSCAVAAVVLQAGQRDASLTANAHTALQSWIDALDVRLSTAGAAPPVARQIAVLLITFLEGTQVLCRAAGDLAAFDEASAAIFALINTRLQNRRPAA